MLLAIDGALAGGIALADTVRGEASSVVRELQRMGIRAAMLTGDNQTAARAIAEQIGIQSVRAEVLPQGKAAEVTRFMKKGSVVAVSYTHLRAHETDSYLVCRLLLEKKKKK